MSTLPGSDKYRVVEPPRQLTWEQQVIQKAKTEIRIEDVLQKYYDIDVPYEAVSWKVRCPYAYEHADGGLDKQFRVYSDSNTGWCFEMHGRVDNLSLYRDQHPYLNYFDAAKSLLEDFDIDFHRKSYREVYEDIVSEKRVDLRYQDIVDAMKLYVSAFPQYVEHEYDGEVVQRINDFNSVVKAKCSNHGSLEEIVQWYQQEKTNMKDFLLSLSG